MRRRTFEPYQAVVVHMGEDSCDGAAILPIQPWRLSTPRAPINVFEEELVHAVIGRVGFQQNLANFGIDRGLIRHAQIISGTVSLDSVSNFRRSEVMEFE